MITVMDSLEQTTKSSENCLDSQLWQACAGSMIQLPPLNSIVFYFPQGHAEHADGTVDFRNYKIPPFVLCRVLAIKYMADPTDEVYAKIRLIPLNDFEFNFDDELGFKGGSEGSDGSEKPSSFAKTLTQSDANNGGGFSVPRYCAETIFPPLDYKADPPAQSILVKDVHGDVWKFRHIYRGTPRRHLLTTGWSNFVNHKKLVAGDSIVFLRAENGDLCVGVRRSKREIGGGLEYGCGWNSGGKNCGYSGDDLRGKVRAESVLEAAVCAAGGHPFEVVYYPRGGSPEFCVKASSFTGAMQVKWCAGMRFKMPFETEDPSRISWFMGTIASVQVADPISWPNSPWRLLQVAWDEPELLQNVKCVSPWLVELVSNMSAIHLSHFAPSSKKLRLSQGPDLSLLGQIPMPSFFGNPFTSSAGIQGARHPQLGISSSDLNYNTLQSSLFPFGFKHLNHAGASSSRIPGGFMCRVKKNDNLPFLLTKGNPTKSSKENNASKPPQLVLFGKVILTEEQISQSSSGDTIGTIGNSSSDGNIEKTANYSDGSGSASHQNSHPENSSDEAVPWFKDHQRTELGLETGHCKVFMESEDVGRTLDLSLLESYEELYEKLANMFDIRSSDMLSNVLYRDSSGVMKHTGDVSFGEFLKTAKRITILMDSESDNIGI